MKVFPLAVYTANHGLDWSYPRGEIDIQELDACRKAFGPLPDFDAGAHGYDAVWATPKRIFVMHCQSVAAWDFRGRDATYLAVTWVRREESAVIDFESLSKASALQQPTKTPRQFFEADASSAVPGVYEYEPILNDGFLRAGSIISRLPSNDYVSFKRMAGCAQTQCQIKRAEDLFPDKTEYLSPKTSAVGGTGEPRLLVPFVVSILICVILAMATALLFIKWRNLGIENSTLRSELDKRTRIERSQPMFLPWSQHRFNKVYFVEPLGSSFFMQF